MSLQGIGDLAQSFQLRRDNARLQQTFQTLANELSSGRKADLGRTVSGDFGALLGIERGLKANEAYATSATETGLMADAAQSALGFVADKAAAVTPALMLAEPGYDPTIVNAAAETAARGFEDAVSALNTRVGDRSVFAGVATDGPALADASVMIDALVTLTAGETTAAGVEAAVRGWFADGGDFETIGYLGAQDALSNIPVSEDERVTLGVTAQDDGLRGVLTGLAMAALLDRGILDADPAERAVLARSAGDQLLTSDFDLTDARSRVGVSQERIEEAKTRNAAEAQALELARSEIVAADPFETASRMRDVELQLEALYTATARMARLNLTAFL